MKLKKILILGMLLFFIFVIYLSTMDKKVYFLALGDSFALGTTPYGGVDYGYNDAIHTDLKKRDVLEKYINGFAKEGLRTTDLTQMIQNNKKIVINQKQQSIKNALIKADLVTLSIGMNDLLPLFTPTIRIDIYDYIDQILMDANQLFELIREYSKEDVIVIGPFNPIRSLDGEVMDEIFLYYENQMKRLCKKYNIDYIATYQIFRDHDYLTNPQSIHPNKEGYHAISEILLSIIERELFS